jgi:hypothetical protein
VAWTSSEPRPRSFLPIFGTAEEQQRWYRLLFLLYVIERGLIGKGDMEAER